jgi:hypothetical protein
MRQFMGQKSAKAKQGGNARRRPHDHRTVRLASKKAISTAMMNRL